MMRLGAAGERAVWMLSILLIGSECGDIHVHLGPTAARRLGHTNSVAIRIRAKQHKRFGAQPSVAFVLAFRT